MGFPQTRENLGSAPKKGRKKRGRTMKPKIGRISRLCFREKGGAEEKGHKGFEGGGSRGGRRAQEIWKENGPFPT